jgi:hypothetical protein
MFNQKLNYYINENPSYVNTSSGAPYTRPEVIHSCGTTINTYKLDEKCAALPLQTWCYKDVAVESFGMRPIVNSTNYYENISIFLKNIIDTDAKILNSTSLTREKYSIVTDYGVEPFSSFLQTIKADVINNLNVLMANSAGDIDMFKNYNPLCEGLIITDIDITTYKSNENNNHFFHHVVFSVVNTTRYNTISMKAEIYQDTTDIMDNWNKVISEIENSKDVNNKLAKVNTKIYYYNIELLNSVKCVTGLEEDCIYSPYSGNNDNLTNKNNLSAPVKNNWLQEYGLANNYYSENGDYDVSGNIKIVDNGPANLDNLIKDLTVYDNNFRQF